MATLFLPGVTRISANTERPIAKVGRHDPDATPLTFSGCFKNVTLKLEYDFGNPTTHTLHAKRGDALD